MSDTFKNEHADLLRITRKDVASSALRERILGPTPPVHVPEAPPEPSAEAEAPRAGLSAALTGKTVLLGGVLIATALGAAYYLLDAAPAHAPAHTQAPQGGASSVATLAVAPALAPQATFSVGEPADSVRVVAPVAKPPHATAPLESDEDALGAEAMLLGQAKHALSSGRPRDAETALHGYERRFPHGALSQEARRFASRSIFSLAGETKLYGAWQLSNEPTREARLRRDCDA